MSEAQPENATANSRPEPSAIGSHSADALDVGSEQAPGLRSQRPGMCFHLAAASAGLFVVTVFALIALLSADPDAPVNIWLNRHGTTLLLLEVAAVVVFGCLAMAADQWSTARRQASNTPIPSPSAAIPPAGLLSQASDSAIHRTEAMLVRTVESLPTESPVSTEAAKPTSPA